MLTRIEGLPRNVLGFEAIGKVTHDDYRRVLIPAAEAMMAKGPVRMLFVIGARFTGYDLEAMWDDSVFGLKHWHDFERLALVTDHKWMRAAISVFTPLIPAEVRLFKLNERAQAQAWITGHPGDDLP